MARIPSDHFHHLGRSLLLLGPLPHSIYIQCTTYNYRNTTWLAASWHLSKLLKKIPTAVQRRRKTVNLLLLETCLSLNFQLGFILSVFTHHHIIYEAVNANLSATCSIFQCPCRLSLSLFPLATTGNSTGIAFAHSVTAFNPQCSLWISIVAMEVWPHTSWCCCCL